MEQPHPQLAARLGMPAPIGWRLVVECVFGIEDSVRLSARAVSTTLALSHTYGGYNRHMLVNEMVKTPSLKAGM